MAADNDSVPPEQGSTGRHKVQEVFGPTWRFWVWIKRQFTLTSLIAILGVAGGMGTWALSLQTRVVVLEARIPAAADIGHLQVIDTRLTEAERRLDAIEDDFEHAREEAVKPALRGRR